MAMELLAFHNQIVPDLASDDQDDDLVALDIIQRTQVSCTQLKVGEWVRPQALDCFRGGRRLVLKPGQDRCFQNPLITRRQGLQLPVRVLRDGNPKRHAISALLMLRALLQQFVEFGPAQFVAVSGVRWKRSLKDLLAANRLPATSEN
jgi:hypothetical protein